MRIDAPDVLPLKPGDGIAIEAEINPPAYLYILWIDADGSVDPVYPWKPGHWEERPAQEQPVMRLRRPETSYFPLGPSTPGMETLVLLARETPLPADVDLRSALGAVRPQASQTLQAMAWFENGAGAERAGPQAVVGRKDRRPGGGDAGADPDEGGEPVPVYAGGEFRGAGEVTTESTRRIADE